MSLFESLNESHIDLFKEIGNIGAGNAATSLSMMMGTKVDISVPNASVIPISKISQIFENPEEIVTGVRMKLAGEISGFILFIVDSKGTKKVLKKLVGYSTDDLLNIDEMSRSALLEVGNIVCGSYLIALSNFSGLNTNAHVPELTVDMVTAVLAETCLNLMDYEDYTMIVETNIIIEDENIRAFLMFLPESQGLKKILQKMGMEV